MRAGTVALVVLSFVALVALGASLAAVEAGTAGTEVAVYNPITASGRLSPTLRVIERLQGTCSGGGVAGRSSYRCLARETAHKSTVRGVFDPCYVARPLRLFYCPTSTVRPTS